MEDITVAIHIELKNTKSFNILAKANVLEDYFDDISAENIDELLDQLVDVFDENEYSYLSFKDINNHRYGVHTDMISHVEVWVEEK